tara:strand:- start:739 stop:1488 length:750 start_codon:yes stop_codon:yes gene_type:complete
VFAFLGALELVIFLLTWFDLGEIAPLKTSRQSSQKAYYMELLTSQRFWRYCMSSALGSGSFFIYLGGAPFVGTEVFGLSSEQLGLYFGAPALSYFTGNFISGPYSERSGVDAMVISGLTLIISGTALSLIVSASGNGSVLSFFGFMCFVCLGNGLTIPNVTPGMLSVRPHLAGTASGLGSAIMIGGGAALSALAGTVVSIDAGETLLILLMETSAILGFATMLLVLRRQRQLAKQESLATGSDRTQPHP